MIKALKELTMADLARVWAYTHNAGARSLLTRQAVENVEGKLVHAFSFRRLPGRIFLFASAKLVTLILHMVRIYTKPTIIPREEWHRSNIVPWANSHWEVGSLLRVQRGKYCGRLGCVVGSSKHSDAVIVAVVPRITQGDFYSVTPKSKRPRLVNGSSALPRGRIQKCEATLFTPEKIEQQITSLARSSMSTEQHSRTNTTQALVSYEYSGPILSNLFGVESGDFDWLVPQSSESVVYQYKQQVFYRGLLLLSLNGHGMVESTVALTSEDIGPFVISGIHSSCDLLLSQMHWKSGQLAKGKEGTIYRIIALHFDCREVEVVTTEGDPLSVVLKMDEIRPHFRPGDEVIVLIGHYRNRSGFVIVDDGVALSIFDTEREEASKFISSRSIVLYD